MSPLLTLQGVRPSRALGRPLVPPVVPAIQISSDTLIYKLGYIVRQISGVKGGRAHVRPRGNVCDGQLGAGSASEDTKLLAAISWEEVM